MIRSRLLATAYHLLELVGIERRLECPEVSSVVSALGTDGTVRSPDGGSGVTCWRCGRSGDHASFCSMPGGCSHCGWSPCRWWCLGPDYAKGFGQGLGVSRLKEPVRVMEPA